jgi:hypothetical protein
MTATGRSVVPPCPVHCKRACIHLAEPLSSVLQTQFEWVGSCSDGAIYLFAATGMRCQVDPGISFKLSANE